MSALRACAELHLHRQVLLEFLNNPDALHPEEVRMQESTQVTDIAQLGVFGVVGELFEVLPALKRVPSNSQWYLHCM